MLTEILGLPRLNNSTRRLRFAVGIPVLLAPLLFWLPALLGEDGMRHEPIRVPEWRLLSAQERALSPPPSNAPRVLSPKGTFTIIQTHDTDYFFRAEAIFKETGKRFVLEPTDFSWAAFYDVSPDERWIFRSQKTGSGDNTAFVYAVKAGSVDTNAWDLGDAAWTYYYATTSNTNGHYHTSTTFVRWTEPQGMVISLNGRSVDEVRALDVHHYILNCDLAKKRFSKGKQLNPPNYEQVPAN